MVFNTIANILQNIILYSANSVINNGRIFGFIVLAIITLWFQIKLLVQKDDNIGTTSVLPAFVSNRNSLASVNKNNIYFILGVSLFNLLLLSYIVLYIFGSSNLPIETIYARYGYTIIGVIASIAAFIWLYTSTKKTVEQQTPIGRMFNYAKLGMKWGIIILSLYYLTKLPVIRNNIYIPLLKLYRIPVDFITNDMVEFNKISYPVRLSIALFLGWFVLYMIYPYVKTYVNKTESIVLAKALKLREQNIVASYFKLHPEYEENKREEEKLAKLEQKPYHKDHNIPKYITNKNGEDYSYGISFKYFLHQVGSYTTQDKDLLVFSYGDKPKITYNPLTQKLKVVTKDIQNNIRTVYETTQLKYQNWEKFIINYINGKIDVFLNGKLIATINDILPYQGKDGIIIGQNDGIEGSVNDVIYSKKPYLV